MKLPQYLVVISAFAVASFNLAYAGQTYNALEDAAVAQAKIWQSGGKANPLMSSDGKVIFAFGQSMPTLTCSPTHACDVEMEPGEKVKKIILGDGANWQWSPAESVEHAKTIQHVIFQPKDSDLESNVIITTDHRTYHIKLYAPKTEGVYLNRVGFYYPEELVSSWSDKADEDTSAKTKDEAMSPMPIYVKPENMAFDYRITGDTDFTPVRVFNDGQRVYIEMPDAIKTGDNPVLWLMDEKDNIIQVNYRREEDPATGKVHYVVEKLFDKAELHSGSEKVVISWKRKEKGFWSHFKGN